jgi:hypothetical protein
MNIVQIHQKTKFYLDSVRSPRFPHQTIDKAINTAIHTIVNDRYDSIRKADREGTFQVSQRLRDEIYTLVYPGTVTPVPGTKRFDIKAAYPEYWLLASMKVTISGKEINTIPLTYDEHNVVENNPFARPSIEYPERVYRIEAYDGVTINHGAIGNLSSGSVYFIKEPITANLGTIVDSGYIDAGTTVICYMDGVLEDGPTNYITLLEGDEYIPSNQTLVISGIFVINHTNCDLPSMLHEEVCKEAAKVLSGTVENYDRVKDLDQQQNLGAQQR